MPGAGNILVFDNGRYRRDYSRVLELDPMTNRIVWSSLTHWYSWHISGAERLPNGNTFICDGPIGRLFEITPEGGIVWEYLNPTIDPKKARKQSAAFDDIGGKDSSYAVYRAVRYPKVYVDCILQEQG